jgi:hypothetical protein
MDKDFMNQLCIDNGLGASDTYKHKNYTIITRSGIEKIQSKNDISIVYEVIRCEELFCVMKAIATKWDKRIETFGSALYGKFGQAMARAVLKISWLYQYGMFWEDEADDFKKSKPKKKSTIDKDIDSIL